MPSVAGIASSTRVLPDGGVRCALPPGEIRRARIVGVEKSPVQAFSVEVRPLNLQFKTALYKLHDHITYHILITLANSNYKMMTLLEQTWQKCYVSILPNKH